MGKLFESDFSKSIPEYCWFKRLNDNAASWSGGENTRFTSNNECDYLMFDDMTRTMYALEMKSTQGTLTFWREDFEDKTKKQSFMIKKNQIKGLHKWSKHLMNCGFIFNLRNKDNRTYFIMIDEFLDYTNTIDKKSINEDDILQMNPIIIQNEKKRTRYKYNIELFLEETKL